MTSPLVIVLATESRHKIEAVKRGFASALGGSADLAVVQTKRVPSGIPEQPVGHEETLKGAYNRLKGALALQGKDAFDFAVAIENGLYSVPSPTGSQLWFDIGWVVIENRLGERHIAACPAIQVPNKLVDYASRHQFQKTVGHALKEEFPHADPNDPHATWTNGALTRTDLLVSGIVAALAQFSKPKSTL